MENYNQHMKEEQNNKSKPQKEENGSLFLKFWHDRMINISDKEWQASSPMHKVKIIATCVLGLLDNLFVFGLVLFVWVWIRWAYCGDGSFLAYATEIAKDNLWLTFAAILFSMFPTIFTWRPLYPHIKPLLQSIFSKGRLKKYIMLMGFVCVAAIFFTLLYRFRANSDTKLPFDAYAKAGEDLLSIPYMVNYLRFTFIGFIYLLRRFLLPDDDEW